jgi:hypothetical protein
MKVFAATVAPDDRAIATVVPETVADAVPAVPEREATWMPLKSNSVGNTTTNTAVASTEVTTVKLALKAVNAPAFDEAGVTDVFNNFGTITSETKLGQETL